MILLSGFATVGRAWLVLDVVIRTDGMLAGVWVVSCGLCWDGLSLLRMSCYPSLASPELFS